ncbi:MAG: hypothetical protein AAFN74_07050, partial [Myxococcota bacterium]
MNARSAEMMATFGRADPEGPMEPVDRPPSATEEELADALPAALERASLLEWRLEQVALREKDLWRRLESERADHAEAQRRVADLTARVHQVEDALAEARQANAALTTRLAQSEETASSPPRVEREAMTMARAWQQAHQRAERHAAALREARERLEILEHAQVRFHARLTQWQRQVATAREDLDLAEFIAELRAEILRLSQVNRALRHELSTRPETGEHAPVAMAPLAHPADTALHQRPTTMDETPRPSDPSSANASANTNIANASADDETVGTPAHSAAAASGSAIDARRPTSSTSTTRAQSPTLSTSASEIGDRRPTSSTSAIGARAPTSSTSATGDRAPTSSTSATTIDTAAQTYAPFRSAADATAAEFHTHPDFASSRAPGAASPVAMALDQLASTEPENRRAAARTLADLDPPTARRAIIEALDWTHEIDDQIYFLSQLARVRHPSID